MPGLAPRVISNTQVVIPDLSRPWQAAQVVENIVGLIVGGTRAVTLDLRSCSRAYPNAVAPLRAALDEFDRKGLNVCVDTPVRSTHLLALEISASDECDPVVGPDECLSNSFRLTEPSAVHEIVTRILSSLSRRHECSPGVLLALEWCLNEIADNVIQHSQASSGVLTVQLQPNRSRLSICVADVGVGIKNSFGDSGHAYPDDEHAIRSALERGVTRDASIHMGNGLWGLREIVRANSGSLGVKSGETIYLLTDERESVLGGMRYLDNRHRGTSVDFQLSLDVTIDVTSALAGYSPVNLRLEGVENPAGEHVVRLKDSGLGTGTRIAGRETRTYILNLLHEGSRRVVIDCKDVRMSSSFIDEVFGMLVVSLGFASYSERVGIRHVHSFDASIMHTIVVRRLSTAI